MKQASRTGAPILRVVGGRAPGFSGDDAALVSAVRAGDSVAIGALFDRHGEHVRRVIARVMGADPELADILHEVFVRALDGIRGLSDPSLLKGWLTKIAVFTAREHIRRRTRRRWLKFFEDPPEVEAPPSSGTDPEANEALRVTYRVLGTLPADERIAFALRLIDGMELTEVAEACEVSLATIKRRIARAEERFLEGAAREPSLREWLEGGTRWSDR